MNSDAHAAVSLEQVTFRHRGGVDVLRSVDLEVPSNATLAVIGPSGEGKTTLLHLIAGLLRPRTGRIVIGGRDVTDRSPVERSVGLVTQGSMLYEHLSVRSNLVLPLRAAGVGRSEARRRADVIADRLGLSSLLRRRPGRLSGGERQRVAIGRALVPGPAILLLDEPFSSLDPLRRAEALELIRPGTVTGDDPGPAAVILVTHDRTVAMTMADRIAVLAAGTIHQVGDPRTCYEDPATLLVADLLGATPINRLEGRILEGGDVEILHGAAVMPGPTGSGTTGVDAGRPVVVAIRPEDLELVVASRSGAWPATIESINDLGDRRDAIVRVHGGGSAAAEAPRAVRRPARLVVRLVDGRTWRSGEAAGVIAAPDRRLVFDAASGRRLTPRAWSGAAVTGAADDP